MQASQTIIILLVANLAATIWFGLNPEQTSAQTPVEASTEHSLPPTVTPQIRDKLYSDFSSAFNAADYDALFDLLGPAAKVQVTKASVSSEFEKLIKYFHSVESGSFTHSELAGTQGSTRFYYLYYAVKLPETSEFGTAATLKITIAVQDEAFQIYGVRLNAG